MCKLVAIGLFLVLATHFPCQVTANSAEVPTAAQLKKKVICMHRAQQDRSDTTV